MADARLVVQAENGETREVEIKGLISIGRAFDNVIRIEDQKVSRYQAVIEERADGFYISDLGSINGTTVGDEKVSSRRKLRDADIISVGGIGKIKFQENLPLPESSSASEAPAVGNGIEEPGLRPTPAPEAGLAAAPSPRPTRGSKPPLLLLLACIAIPVVLLVVVVGFLISNSAGEAEGRETIAVAQKDMTATAALENARDAREATDDRPSADRPAAGAAGVPVGDGMASPDLSLEDIRSMCAKLAQDISGKRDYVFDKDFLIKVGSYVGEYRNVENDVRVCRQIGQYCYTQNVPFILGVTLAIQRSKLNQSRPAAANSGVGLLMLPRPIAKSYITSKESEDAVNNSDRATEIGIAYLKEVVDSFRFGKEDFAYAVAYYGASSSAIGEGTEKLNELYPEASLRKNFWRTMTAKSLRVPENASDNVARFFAAGIVGENPKKFGLLRNPLSQF